MNPPKAKSTSRKFYGKWLFKVSLALGSASIFREHSLQSIIDFCNNTVVYSPYSIFGRAAPYRAEIKELATFLSTYTDDIWSKRIESDQIDLYTNDRAFYDAVVSQFSEKIIHRFEPAAGADQLLDSTGTIIVKKLPHNRYNYRVYLQPHKMAQDTEGKEKYISWLKQQDRITCTPAIQEWFYKTNWNWDRRYVLVEDEQTLLMLKLRNSEVVGRIYKFEVSDK
jgi:hypothetical protein